MLHLLPDYQKKKVLGIYRLRLLVVVLIILLVFGGIMLVSLIPTYAYVLTQKQSLASKKGEFQTIINSKSYASAGQDGVEITRSIDALKPISDTLIPSVFINKIKPQGLLARDISIQGYSFTISGPNQITIVLTGIGRTRESLTAFVSKLDAEFKGVKLPLASLAKQSDIPFEFRIITSRSVLESIQE